MFKFMALWQEGHGLFMANFVAGTDISAREVRMMGLGIPSNIHPRTGEAYDDYEDMEERTAARRNGQNVEARARRRRSGEKGEEEDNVRADTTRRRTRRSSNLDETEH